MVGCNNGGMKKEVMILEFDGRLEDLKKYW